MRYFSLKPPAASSSFSMSLILWAAATLSARGIGEKSNLQLYQKIEKYEVRRTRKYEVRSAKYEVKITTNLLPYFVLLTSSFLLSVVRMSLQDGESAIELLQQHHSRQLVRQRDAAERNYGGSAERAASVNPSAGPIAKARACVPRV